MAVCRHEAYDSRADCWSFGVLLVELLTQQKPYSQLYLTPVQVAIQVGPGPGQSRELAPVGIAALGRNTVQQALDSWRAWRIPAR